MQKPTFAACAAYSRIANLPEGLNDLYAAYAPQNPLHPLLRREFLAGLCKENELGAAGEQRLFAALDEIERDETLLYFSNFLVEDLCAARHRMDIDDYQNLVPTGAMRDPDVYAFLLLLACIEPSLRRLETLGIPREEYIAIPFEPARRQMQKLRENGDAKVADFPWDMNFYTGSLFHFNRFRFIPFKIDDDIAVYRNGDKVVAFYVPRTEVRRDGQFNGVNGQYDPQFYESEYKVENGTITGNPIHPAGIIENRRVVLNAAEWTLVLQKGDILLGTHIPSGPGYDPDHLRDSCVYAYEFYKKWFPEIDVKGCGSESWLYDPHLACLLGGRGNIADMQKQMYVYPILRGDGMTRAELFGDNPRSPEKAKLKTSLQRNAVAYMQKGHRMTTCSMFILPEELRKIGQCPYAAPGEYEKVWQLYENPPVFEKAEDAT